MSFTTIHVYDGDPAEYRDEQETATIGVRVPDEEQTFHDGEELDCAAAMMKLLAEGRQFDVRSWFN